MIEIPIRQQLLQQLVNYLMCLKPQPKSIWVVMDYKDYNPFTGHICYTKQYAQYFADKLKLKDPAYATLIGVEEWEIES